MSRYNVKVEEVNIKFFTIDIPDDIPEEDREEYFYENEPEADLIKGKRYQVESMDKVDE